MSNVFVFVRSVGTWFIVDRKSMFRVFVHADCSENCKQLTKELQDSEHKLRSLFCCLHLSPFEALCA